jgi:hypothetical protein
MHCPNCGNESDLEQKFCRQCGFNLAPVSRLILAGKGDEDDSKLDKTERDKLIIRRMVSWMMWGMLIMLIGIVFAVVNKQLKVDQLVGLVGTLLILGGLSVTAYGVLDALRGGGLKTRKPKAMPAASQNETEPAPTTKELDGRTPIPLASVTERTTQLIRADSDQAE